MADSLTIPARTPGGPDPVADAAALRAVAAQRAGDLGLLAPALPTHKPLVDDLRALVAAANVQADAVGVQGTGMTPSDVAGAASPAGIVNALVTTWGRIETALAPVVVDPDPEPVTAQARVRVAMPPVRKTDNTTRTVVVPLPDYQPGDRWVIVPQSTGNWRFVQPAGWQVGGELQSDATWKTSAVVFWRDPDGTQPASLTLSMTPTGATATESPAAVHVYALSGVAAAAPVAQLSYNNTGGTAMAHPGLDVPADGTLLLQVLTSSAGGTPTWTHATGFTQDVMASRLEAGNNDVQLSTAVRYDVPQGPTGTLNASTSTLARWTNLVLAFAPGVVVDESTPPTQPTSQAPALTTAQPTWSATSTSVTGAFTTTVAATRHTEYRVATDTTWTPQSYVPPEPRTDHSATIGGLQPGTTYQVRYRLVSEAGAETTVGPFTTSTTAPPATGAVTLPPIDRSGYPDGWQTWPVVYHVPPGSTFQAPNGERVVRSGFMELGITERVRLRCPETFLNVSKGWRINQGSYIVEGGVHLKNTKWNGPGSVPMVARTSADAKARRNLFPIAPGRTYCDQDGRVAPGDECRAAMLNGAITSAGSGVNTFRSIEGLYIEGDWFWEGLNYDSRYDRGGLRIQHARVDRVNVCYTRNSSGDLTGKTGGDAFQCWKNPGELQLLDFTVAASSIQGFFLQTQMGRQTFRRINLRSAERDPYGEAFYLWWNAPASSGVIHDQVFVEGDPSRSRDLTIWPKGAFTGSNGIAYEPHEDFVTREAWLRQYRPALAA